MQTDLPIPVAPAMSRCGIVPISPKTRVPSTLLPIQTVVLDFSLTNSSHRLSTLRKANKIIVVDKGEIIEMGTPEELMALKGKYYKLIQIQTMSDEIRKTKEEERFE